jgi:hypothetical protein
MSGGWAPGGQKPRYCIPFFSRDSNGTMHMTGFVSQWPDMPSVVGNWAISGSTGDRIAVFKVKQLTSFDNCDCHEKS